MFGIPRTPQRLLRGWSISPKGGLLDALVLNTRLVISVKEGRLPREVIHSVGAQAVLVLSVCSRIGDFVSCGKNPVGLCASWIFLQNSFRFSYN